MKTFPLHLLGRFVSPVAVLLLPCMADITNAEEPRQPSAIRKALENLPVHPNPHCFDGAAPDWLITAPGVKAAAYRSKDGRFFVLDNGLIRRTWRIDPNLACVSFDNLTSGKSLLRAVRPEARVVIDGTAWNVGGLTGQPNQAYLSHL